MTKTRVRKHGTRWLVLRRGGRQWAFYTWTEAIESLHNLYWHYGPTVRNSDPGKMWCYDCGAEVYGFKEGYICSGCSRGCEDA
jgi:hypothetical protein